MKKSPFKFLDPFTLEDKNIFFGRKKETRQLHRQVLRTRLLLLYGLSGTGKTSLIQCGLAGEFNGPDWLPIWIRRQTNIDDSLQSAIWRLLPGIKGSIPEQIRELYREYYRPVYLIFDQFEELFILGKEEEKKLFTATLKSIMSEDLPCTVVLVIREEFLGRLYPIEKAIPGLFDFRMRVEPMEVARVKEVLINSFREFNISIAADIEENTKSIEEHEINNEDPADPIELIINKISQGKSGIELPYLQVYLDQLYRRGYEDADDILPGQKWPDRKVTREEIRQLGTLKNVLAHYLNEQKQQIQEKVGKLDPSTPEDTVKLVLDGFVTEEVTKRPVRYTLREGLIAISPAQQRFFPTLKEEKALTLCLRELEGSKILRSKDDYIELAHDSLAAIINDERSDEERERNNMRSQIRLALANFEKSKEYLTPKQLVLFEDVLPELKLSEEETNFFEESKKIREDEAKADLEKEKAHSAELSTALNEAETARKEAETARQNEELEREKAENALQDVLSAKQEELKARIEAKEALDQAKTASKEAKEALAYAKNASMKATEALTVAEFERANALKKKRVAKNWLIAAVIGFIVTFVSSYLAYTQSRMASEARETAYRFRDSASRSDSISKITLKQLMTTKLKAYLLDADTFLKSGDTAEANSALKFARTVNDTYFSKDTAEYQANQKQIEKIEDKRKNR